MLSSKDFQDIEYCPECDSSQLEIHVMDEERILLRCNNGHIFTEDRVRKYTAYDQYSDYGDTKAHGDDDTKRRTHGRDLRCR
jgi:hypothetical protein